MYQSRTRKRVNAIRRAPDGSAFQKCGYCGVSVPIALNDMHECEEKRDVKRLKGECRSKNSIKQRFQDQPRSEFRFFMESFVNTCKDVKEIDVDNKGFEMWKNMSKEERRPYALLAQKVNSAYAKALLAEADHSSGVEDEADSADVGKYDEKYKADDYYVDSEYSNFSESLIFETSDRFDTYERGMLDSWISGNSS